MITFLLWALAIFLVATVVYVFGRLIFDTIQLFRDRAARDDSAVLWRDVGAIGIAAQVLALVVISALLAYLWSNFRARTDLIGLDLTFDFLKQPGNITIADNGLTAGDSVAEAITQAFLNTLRVIAIGIPLAMIVGTLVGISRFSDNWILRKLATSYVEFFRNIPPLVVIVFLWAAVFLQFPRSQESWTPFDWFVFNNARFAFPSMKRTGDGNYQLFMWVVLFAIIAAIAVGIWRTSVFNNTGTPHKRTLWGFGTLIGIIAVAYVVLGAPVTASIPTIDDRGRVITDGIRMQMPYAALTFALVIYTSTHISEIVRGSILAVHKGQEEAGNALALSTVQKYRFVILPQAFRVAFPPLISQMLNFAKNSSLALPIGFTETTSSIQNLFGQSQPAPQLLLILALLYLTISLVLSAVGNVVNRRLQLVGR